ncbi:interleukin 20 receptor subunit beta [Homo sapiens]|uniref:Interleukin 20 receptor subunit beta n=1 Tax=Homo sapiens TaxID=9606 RepID=F8WAV8_HUMAN|nr:interleukin 20 receptor subunit beta [Homo sapiens]KAI4031727.1 interleukin 20 receptor subunit beta [Homo sapiens]
MAGAPSPASLPPCSLISDCCASNQRDSVGVGPSEPGWSAVVQSQLTATSASEALH